MSNDFNHIAQRESVRQMEEYVSINGSITGRIERPGAGGQRVLVKTVG